MVQTSLLPEHFLGQPFEDFLKDSGLPPGSRVTFLAGDCSPRTYYRIVPQQPWWRDSVILMNAPPEAEDIGPFLEIGAFLKGAGLRVPEIYAVDHDAGLILLEDFGDQTYNRVLAGQETQTRSALYQEMLDVLIYTATLSKGEVLKDFGVSDLIDELNSFLYWGTPTPLTDLDREDARTLWRDVLTPLDACTQRGLALRDYHVDNLMRLPAPGLQGCGLLDFQDARWGLPAYDVVSLLQDARVDVGEPLEKEMLNCYIRSLSPPDRDAFENAYGLLGLQRATKILGIFLRRARKDGRPEMLAHCPRVWRFVQKGLKLPQAQPLVPLFRQQGFVLEAPFQLSDFGVASGSPSSPPPLPQDSES